MPAIRFIVTGDLEKQAIVDSVRRLFPDQVGGQTVEYFPTRKAQGGATTYPLPPVGTGKVPTNLERLVRKMLAEVLDGDKDGKPDLVVGLDDLELANLHQPGVVVGWVRCAVQADLDRRFGSSMAREQAAHVVQRRCSLHLLVPMIEAYFFGDPSALQRAGVDADVPYPLAHGDLENFETSDSGFLLVAAARNAEKQGQGYPWWREEKHPKSYLEHLVEGCGRLYDEPEGAAALRTLGWPAVSVAGPPLGFARSLFEDLSDWFGLPSNVLGPGVCSALTYPARTVDRSTLFLRNL